MKVNSDILWHCKEFLHLSSEELYRILQLRNEVFVVEQHCIYQDCDDKDLKALHLSGYSGNRLVAYARILPVGVSYADGASLGRIVTAPSERRKKFGRALMEKAIQVLNSQFGDIEIIISAQAYLQKFYNEFGFVAVGSGYPEDGIPHIQMRKGKNRDSQ